MSKRLPLGQTLLGGDQVPHSPDIDRVLALERRPRPVEGSPEAEELIDTVTSWFSVPSKPGCDCKKSFGKPCVTRLRFIQAWALFELATERGLFGIIGTGYGKTLMNVLAPLALPGTRHALLFVKANLVGQLKKDYAMYARHWRVPTIRIHSTQHGFRCQQPNRPDGTPSPVLNVVSYNKLSDTDASQFIESIGPDLVLSDESQCFSDRTSTRTRRWQRYMAEADAAGVDPRFGCSSGTVMNGSIMDYWHLLITALRENAPLPLDEEVAEQWAECITPDKNAWASPPGALEVFCLDGEEIQEAYFRRLVETPGVVSTDAPSVDVRVEVRDRFPDPGDHPTTLEVETGARIPTELYHLMQDVRDNWTRPDGMVFDLKIEQWRCLYQLACGFYLRWEFVHGETDEQIETWKKRRAAYTKEVRDVLERNIRYMDSPELARAAAERFLRGEEESPKRPVWDCWALEPWLEVENTVRPITVPVRVCDFAAADAARWAIDATGEKSGIVWYESVEFGTWVCELAREAGHLIPLHDGGPTAGDRIDAEDGTRSIVASVRSHGTGRDGLQYKFLRQLLSQPFATSWGYEQLFGRLARVGQEHDVFTEIYAHTPELVNSYETACTRATYVQRTTGVHQQLLAGRALGRR